MPSRHSLQPAFALLLFAALATPAVMGQGSQQGGQEEPPQVSVPVPLAQGTRLYLKDGSFHVVRSYEKKGDRVRYWSIERSAWEEIPTDVVDWEATRKGEVADADRRKQIDQNIKDIEANKRAESLEVDASLEISPGVFLPDGIGLFVVQNGAVTSLAQSEAQSKINKVRLLAQVMVGSQVIPSGHRIVLPGAHAALRLSSGQPEFYMRTVDGREPKIELVQAHVKSKERHIETLTTYMTGDTTAKRNAISIEGWQEARGVYRYTLGTALPPGEYAFAELTKGEVISLYVWDFGVDGAGTATKVKQKK